MNFHEWYAEYGGGKRGLSGIRREKATRVFWQDITFGIVTAAIVITLGLIFGGSNIALYALVGMFAGQLVFRLVRKETYPQLRLQERKLAKDKADNALEELNKYAEKLKNEQKRS